MNARFGYTILYVDDVEASLGFYERAFGLVRRMLADEKNYGELESGSTRLAFAANSFVRQMLPTEIGPSGLQQAAPPCELGMVTEDVDAAFRQALAAGAIAVKSPETKPWGQMVGYVRDPNGFLVEICSELP
jgi:lactoylglutathione lyase